MGGRYGSGYLGRAVTPVAVLWVACHGANVTKVAHAGSLIPLADDNTHTVRIHYDDIRSAPSLEAVPNLTLGSGSNGPQDEFGITSGVAVDGAGRIYIFDPMSFRIRVFDSQGRFVRDIGRRGHGPGEFHFPHGANERQTDNGITISHDTIFALDTQIIAFDTAGKFLGSSSMSIPVNEVASITSSPDGLVMQQETWQNAPKRTFRFATYDFRKDKELLSFSVLVDYPDFGDHISRPPLPLPTLPFDITAEGSVMFAVGDSFDLRRIDVGGKVRTEFVSDAPRVPLMSRDLPDHIRSFDRAVAEEMRPSPAEREKAEKAYAFQMKTRPKAPFRPTIGIVITSAEALILVQRLDIAEGPFDWYAPTGVPWLLMSDTGSPMGTVSLPGSFIPKLFMGCDLYGSSNADPSGAPLIMRFRLRATGLRCKT